MRPLFAAVLCLSLSASLPARAADPAPAPKTSAAQLLSELHFEQGKITLPEKIATLDLPPSFRYLGPADTSRILVDGWGNPPGAQTLGMIVPADVNPLGAAGWGVVVTYNKDGHVKDDDAGKIDYADLLKDMKEAVAADNQARKEAGYGSMALVGWAEPPSYDKTAHKLYWAKELQFGGEPNNGLNYNVRVLGRKGVLVLNAVADMRQIAQVKAQMQDVTAFADFTPGNRYADFDDKTDKVAEYGIAALVAGGVAAKLGLFGKLLALLIAFKKIILVAFIAGSGWLFKLLGRGKKVAPAMLEAPAEAPAQQEQPSGPVSLDKPAGPVNLDKP